MVAAARGAEEQLADTVPCFLMGSEGTAHV